MIIYKITNKINNKIYIGLTTKSFSERIGCYRSSVKSEKPIKHRVIQAMKKHGFDNFIFEQIELVENREELKQKEVNWIAFYKSTNPSIGYNVSPGGDLCSIQTNVKRANSLKGKKRSIESKLKTSKSLMGHTVTEETRLKQSKSKIGCKSWSKGTKGILKSNSGTFGNGRSAPNKGRKRIIVNGKVKFIKGNNDIQTI